MPESRKKIKRETREARQQEKMLRREAVRAFEYRVERMFVDDDDDDDDDDDEGVLQVDAGEEGVWSWLCGIWLRWWWRKR
jgi:hypothetical protein